MHLSLFTTFCPPIFWFAHPIFLTSLCQCLYLNNLHDLLWSPTSPLSLHFKLCGSTCLPLSPDRIGLSRLWVPLLGIARLPLIYVLTRGTCLANINCMRPPSLASLVRELL